MIFEFLSDRRDVLLRRQEPGCDETDIEDAVQRIEIPVPPQDNISVEKSEVDSSPQQAGFNFSQKPIAKAKQKVVGKKEQEIEIRLLEHILSELFETNPSRGVGIASLDDVRGWLEGRLRVLREGKRPPVT